MVSLLTLCHVHWQFNNASFGPVSVEGTCSLELSLHKRYERKWAGTKRCCQLDGKHDFIELYVTADEFSTVSDWKEYICFGVSVEFLGFVLVCCPMRWIQLSLAFWLNTFVSCLFSLVACRLSDVTLNSHYLLEIISCLSLAEPLLSLIPVHW